MVVLGELFKKGFPEMTFQKINNIGRTSRQSPSSRILTTAGISQIFKSFYKVYIKKLFSKQAKVKTSWEKLSMEKSKVYALEFADTANMLLQLIVFRNFRVKLVNKAIGYGLFANKDFGNVTKKSHISLVYRSILKKASTRINGRVLSLSAPGYYTNATEDDKANCEAKYLTKVRLGIVGVEKTDKKVSILTLMPNHKPLKYDESVELRWPYKFKYKK